MKNKNVELVNETTEVQNEVSDNVAAFFAENPKAPSVLQVGETLFLNHAQGAATEYATRIGEKVVEIINPKFSA